MAEIIKPGQPSQQAAHEQAEARTQLAMMCLQAERTAAAAGPEALGAASFQLVMPAGDQKGPRVWVLPGLFGTMGLTTSSDGRIQVTVTCSEVRGYFTKLLQEGGPQGMVPELGVDPGAICKAFLEYWEPKDGNRAKRLQRVMAAQAGVKEQEAEGDE